MAYGIMHTKNVLGSKPMSFISANDDMENGFFFMKGDLAPNERELYLAVKPTAANLKEKAYVVDDPAWSYDTSKASNQNEENYIVKKNKPFRGRDFDSNNKFEVTSYSLTGDIAVGNYVVPAAGTYKGNVVATADLADYGWVGKIELIEDIGYFHYIGSYGTDTDDGTTDGVLGVDSRAKMVTISVIKNA